MVVLVRHQRRQYWFVVSEFGMKADLPELSQYGEDAIRANRCGERDSNIERNSHFGDKAEVDSRNGHLHSIAVHGRGYNIGCLCTRGNRTESRRA